MKTYIKPETILADMLTAEHLLEASLKTGTTVKDEVVDNTSYTKENNGWDDYDE